MIFNILIVDDEAPIRKGLSQFIHWENLDCTIAATASDGREAIAILQEMPIHIVITDIRMPEVNGLKLAEYIHRLLPHIKVIILTGFADFQYAQAAIKYGVSDFIIKPIAKDTLIASVRQAQESIILSNQKQLVQQSEIAFLRELLLQELTHSSNPAQFTAKLQHYGIALNDYLIAAFQLMPEQEDISSLKEIIIAQNAPGYCYRYNNIILLIYLPEADEPQKDRYLPTLCREISDIISSLYNRQIFIGISRHHCGVLELSAAVSEAIYALSLNFYSKSNLSYCSEAEANRNDFLTTAETLQLYELEMEILRHNFAEANKIVRLLFHHARSKLSRPADVKNLCIQMFYIGFKVSIRKEIKAPDDTILLHIHESKNIYELELVIHLFMDNLQEHLTGLHSSYSKIVTQAIEYINYNLPHTLHLKVIAEALHVNASYLSRIFRKETGHSITEFINLSRIERAKEMLAASDCLTYEIAEQVGYHDPAYFSCIFKKITGLTPKEYKARYE